MNNLVPFCIEEKYPTDDLTVAVYNVADSGVDLSGKLDAAPLLQTVIDEVHAAGGGVIYLPEGKYALRTPIEIKTAVTLRGEWISPDCSPASTLGTILLCYCGKDDADGVPQITMRACTGLKDITLFYPEQCLENPTPYSPAVRQHGVDSMTLENVTIINPWTGVQAGPDANELHYLKNVYISPLHTGFFMDMTTDIGRMENLNISPRYLSDFTGIPLETVRNYMLRETTGVFMARSDWEYGYKINVEYCKTGFMITSFKDSGPNTQLSNLHFHNCDTAINLVNVNPYGVALSDSIITADIPGLNAAIESGEMFKTVVQLNGVDISGSYTNLVKHHGDGQLSFVNCTFAGWIGCAFDQYSGGISVEQCSFNSNGTHFKLHDAIGGTQILGCKFSGNPVIDCSQASRDKLLFSDKPLGFAKIPRGGHKPYPYAKHPKSRSLYNVMDYGALSDGKSDNTTAFTAALSEAAKTGGIVYVPAGWYRFDNTLVMPANVELRGVFETPCHTMGGGSVLQVFSGRDNEDATPFITLNDNAGIRGIVFHYPEQSPSEPHKYPWTVQARGKYCRLINTVFVNSWLGADFASYPSEGHYLSYISGAPIRCGIFIGSNDGEGWIENIQYNPHYWFRCSLPNAPKNNDWHDFWHNQIKYLEALKFGYNKNEHLLGTFVFAAKHGLQFVLQDGKGTNGKFIGHGTDGGENGLFIEGIGNCDFINTELVTIESPLTRVYMLTAKDATGEARMFNTLMWGAPDYAIIINGGKIEMQQVNIVESGKTAITINGGEASFDSIYFYRNSSNAEVTGGKSKLVGCMTPRRSDSNLPLEIKLTGGQLLDQFNWNK